jgi:hypothetical protein
VGATVAKLCQDAEPDSPDVATRHASVFETRPKRRRPPRLTDGKDHPVVVRQLSFLDSDDEQPDEAA